VEYTVEKNLTDCPPNSLYGELGKTFPDGKVVKLWNRANQRALLINGKVVNRPRLHRKSCGREMNIDFMVRDILKQLYRKESDKTMLVKMEGD
jgi:hypothetical protein